MTDKIITTFETTLTWYDPFDILPEKFCEILIKVKNGPIFLTNYFPPYNPEDVVIFDGEQTYYTRDKIEWWAYLPSFGDEK